MKNCRHPWADVVVVPMGDLHHVRCTNCNRTVVGHYRTLDLLGESIRDLPMWAKDAIRRYYASLNGAAKNVPNKD